MRRIRVVVVSVLLMVALAATMVALPAFAGVDSGKTDAGNNKNGFGSAASQQAQNKGDDGKGGLGRHARDPEGDGPGPRKGVGNVAREEDPNGDGHVADHGCNVGSQMGINCNDRPGSGK